MDRICKLCNNHIADKTGSHIVPHFLLKRIENEEGKTGRGNELGFVIKTGDTFSYFGREVSPEKLEEVYGDLTEEEIEANSHPLIIDHIFCSQCERKLGVIEEKYSQTLNLKSNNNYSSGVQSALGLLFWASIIWRLSISGNGGMRLSDPQNERLREMLFKILKTDFKEMDLTILKKMKSAKGITYKLIRSPDYSKSSPTFLHFYPDSKYPYTLIIWEYILFFSFSDNYTHFLKDKFFGIQNQIFAASTNKPAGDEELIFYLPIDVMKRFNNGLIEFIKNIRVDSIFSKLDALHVKLGGNGTSMPDIIKKEIMQEITSDEKKIGRAQTAEDLAASSIKVLQKYIRK